MRFNFRGVGASTGNNTGQPGALEDALTAFDFLQKQHPSLPFFAGGFSFGATTALSLALQIPRVQRVLAVGTGVDFFDMRFVAQLQTPVAFVHAEKDTFGKLENLQTLANRMQAPNKLFVVSGASHLFLNHMKSLEAQLTQAIAWLMSL